MDLSICLNSVPESRMYTAQAQINPQHYLTRSGANMIPLDRNRGTAIIQSIMIWSIRIVYQHLQIWRMKKRKHILWLLIFVSISTFTDFHWLASCTKQFIIDGWGRSVDPLFASFTLITPPNMTFHVMLPPQQENDQICGNTAYYGLASDII